MSHRDKCLKCGQVLRFPRKEKMTRRLVESLIVLYKAGGGPLHPRKEMGLGHVSWNTFQKLRYWNLVEKTGSRGFWKITDYGRAFIEHRVSVPYCVEVFNNEVTFVGKERIWVTDMLSYDDPAWGEVQHDT